MGDAAGIGPEVVVKALASREIYAICRPLLVGSGDIVLATIKSLGIKLAMKKVKAADETSGHYGVIDILDLHNLNSSEVAIGTVCRPCGRAAMEYIEAAAAMVLRKEVSAMVTAPINKEATRLAGYGDVGHLEFLARYTDAVEYATMLVADKLRVVHLTTHHSLKDACTLVTKKRVLARLHLIEESFPNWGIKNPRIGVAALNPHGGEGGLFGREEIDFITPAIEEARQAGIDARGPFPADSIFTRAIGGEFDVVLAMYHDQGHIPIKVHNFEKSVSVALGLPFIRTSVDHGTAFDIAGQGKAEARSMIEAIKMAVDLIAGKFR